jgi:hypothetical protein
MKKRRIKMIDYMTDVLFADLCKSQVYEYVKDTFFKGEDTNNFTKDNVYVVWQVKVLQNWKALVSTTIEDGMYYELTLNGDKGELYLDAYKKQENKTINVGEYYASLGYKLQCSVRVYKNNKTFTTLLIPPEDSEKEEV